MGKHGQRYVMKAEPGSGWRVWDRHLGRWWGIPFASQPYEVLRELNGERREGKIIELLRAAQRKAK
jgi:hypothetical protein